jgi:adenine nucleotide transporter 17
MQFKPPTSGKLQVEGGVITQPEEGSEYDRHDGAVQILQKVYKKHGLLGWYKVAPFCHLIQGLNTQISKAVLTQAILFYFKEVFTEYTILLIALARRIASKKSRLVK